MKRKLTVIAGLTALALTLTACGGDDDSDDAASGGEASGTLNVWLMQDAFGEAWAPVVEAATAKFNEEYPDVDVEVTEVQWTGGQERLNTALAGSSPPDVVELGNTWTSGFASSGALADLTDSTGEFENSDTWVKSLQDAATFEDQVYGVPYYGGSRVITYRTDMFEQAGITEIPTSMDDLKAAADKLQAHFGATDPNFSAFWIPGQHWYLGGALIADQGAEPFGQFEGGKWVANVDSPESVAGLELFEELRSKYSKADPTGEEADQAYRMGGQKNIAMIYGAGWEMGEVLNAEKGGDPALEGMLAQFPLPSSNAGETAPAFIGGSHLAVPVKSDQQDLAKAWIAAYTSTDIMTQLVNENGVIPNTTSLLSLDADNPAFQAAQNSWFVPTSPNWAEVEGQRIPQNTFVAVSTGTPAADAAATATEDIQAILDK